MVVFELEQCHRLGETVMQQVVLPEAVHLPSKLIQLDDHSSLSSGLLVLVVVQGFFLFGHGFCLCLFGGFGLFFFFLSAVAAFP